MYMVLLVIHLILALTIIGLVLMQRSAGGGFVGGGGGMGDFASARGAANALTKITTWCALLFFATSIGLALIIKNDQKAAGILANVEQPATPTATDAPVVPTVPAPAPAAPISKE